MSRELAAEKAEITASYPEKLKGAKNGLLSKLYVPSLRR